MSIKNVLLGTLLGDSCVRYRENKGNFYGEFSITHCYQQKDYIDHIASLIRKEYNEHVSVYDRKSRSVLELANYNKRWVEWRDKYYPNNKKDPIAILNDVTDPIEALSYWLMDDGCIHYSTKNKDNLSPRLLIATCSETEETHIKMIEWFQKNFNVSPYITKQRNKKRNKEWLLLKFTVGDSCKIWQKVRHKIISIPSMKYKFRIVEQEFRKDFYKIKYLQESPTS
jgi:hypothetical protein